MSSRPGRVKIKTIKFVMAASLPKHTALRNKSKYTGWFGMRIMYPSDGTPLPADWCFGNLAL